MGIKTKGGSGSNRLGFNDLDYPEKNDFGIRIIGLGDSFNWAGGYKNNYWTLAEKILNDRSPPLKIEVLNQGTPMIGPAYLLQLLKTTSIKFDPNIVVLSFFVGNNFGESDPNTMRLVRFGLSLNKNLAARPFSLEEKSHLWFLLKKEWLVLTGK